MANPNLGTIAATTIKNYRSTFADNLTNHNVVLATLRSKGFIREDEGGTSIVETLLYGSNSTVKSFSKYDLLDVTPQEGIDAAEYLWKQLAGAVTISGKEEFENKSRARIINLLEAKMTQLDISFQEEVGRQICGDGTGNGSKDITGLQLAVEEGTAWSVYGAIDSNLYAFWRNNFLNFTGTYTSFGTAHGKSVQGMAALRTMYNNVSRKNEKPDLILTTQDVYELYEAHAEGDKLRMTSTKVADMGFTNILFKDVPIVWDENVPSGYAWFLNNDYLRFVVGKGKNFVHTPFVTPHNQDAKSSQVLLYCNITCANRKRQGLISNLA